MNPLHVMAALALLLGLIFSILNWATIFISRRRGRYVSPVPLLGALLVSIGLLSFPSTSSFWWTSIILDYGTLMLVLALPSLAIELWSTSWINRIHEFTATREAKHVKVSLYRGRRAVITLRFSPGQPCNSHGALIESMGLTGNWTEKDKLFRINAYGEDRSLLLQPTTSGYTSTEVNYPQKEFDYDRLDGLHYQKT